MYAKSFLSAALRILLSQVAPMELEREKLRVGTLKSFQLLSPVVTNHAKSSFLRPFLTNWTFTQKLTVPSIEIRTVGFYGVKWSNLRAFFDNF